MVKMPPACYRSQFVSVLAHGEGWGVLAELGQANALRDEVDLALGGKLQQRLPADVAA